MPSQNADLTLHPASSRQSICTAHDLRLDPPLHAARVTDVPMRLTDVAFSIESANGCCIPESWPNKGPPFPNDSRGLFHNADGRDYQYDAYPAHKDPDASYFPRSPIQSLGSLGRQTVFTPAAKNNTHFDPSPPLALSASGASAYVEARFSRQGSSRSLSVPRNINEQQQNETEATCNRGTQLPRIPGGPTPHSADTSYC